MASTSVDLPEPMSPVSSALSPSEIERQTLLVEGAPVDDLHGVEPHARPRLRRIDAQVELE